MIPGRPDIQWIGPMNILPFDKQIAAVATLTEDCSIRPTERVTGIHRDTIMRLGARVGEGCAKLHAAMMQDLQYNFIQVDELWSYVCKKHRKLTKTDSTDLGDCYTFTALDNTAKDLIAYRVGKRDGDNCRAFI